MNLFLKIFLWFLAALALMVGVVLFLNWTVQTEPVVSRWRTSVRNQMQIYSETAAQIHAAEGDRGLTTFIQRIRNADTVTEVDVVHADGTVWFAEGANVSSYKDLIARATASDDVEIQTSPAESSALAGKTFTLSGGEKYVLILRWTRPRPMPFFGDSQLRYLRFAGLLLTALLLCYALARYLSTPIGKIREATQKLAKGDLKTRVADEFGNRRDELATLAKDFDVMAERIESLVTSQQRLSRDVSHELRSPLARLNVALEIAKQKTNGDIAPLLDRIGTESGRLNEMIAQLLTLSRLESGSRDFDRREINLKTLVERIAADADFEANAVGKSVKIVKAENCKTVGSESLIESAVENVLRNAVRYTKEDTIVEVSLTAEAGRSAITVTDHGGGVPEDQLDKLFRPFYRVGEARERKTGGIGLGLAIAEQSIRAHEGTIAAKNVADGLAVEIRLDCV